MGSCYSVHGNAETDMKLKFSFGSKTEKLVAPSPLARDKENLKNGCIRWTPTRSTTTFSEQGGKEEAFFDSKAWLDSDFEDDFYSVNGDFMPSRGNTPVHPTFGTPILNKTTSVNRISSSMPKPSTEKKKNLFELFLESIKGDQDGKGNEKKDAKPTILDVLPKSAHSTAYISGADSACSSEKES